jgi:pullulanase
MKDTFISAKLVGTSTIRLLLLGPLNKEAGHPFLLITDGIKIETLRVEKTTPLSGGWAYDLKSYNDIILGHQYDLVIEGFGRYPLDVGEAINFPDFDREFYYEGSDLGARHTKEATTFKLWAPLASRVMLEIKTTGTITHHLMKRVSHGVYELTLPGDLSGAVYSYLVTNNGPTVSVTDPYSFGTTPNGEQSVVIDFEEANIPLNEGKLPKFARYTDAIIYETSVRDLTMDPLLPFTHKGRFLSFVESGVKTNQSHPAGFDHLLALGVTHVQLLPIYDFQTVDERDPGRFYNWGYDPMHYFVPEGSFASDLDDPYSRIRDLKKLVAACHDKGLRVVMDVVYNHVYHAHLSVFEKTMPGYYFRRRKDGRLSNGSFCGNDVATERPMVRKLLVEASLHWVKTYGIDGFRFDLMSNIDQTTIRQIQDEVRRLKPDFMLYGEGWNMPTELPENLRSSMLNSGRLPEFAFFNDAFRDTVKGPTMDDRLKERGYLLGASSFRLGFKYAFAGSCLDLVFPARFSSAKQSINYVECHDNGTLFDKMLVSNAQESITVRLKRLRLINAVTMLSFGIPFFHMGQEVGLTKGGDLNSFKSGDKVNRFDYRILDERHDLAAHFADVAKVRKMFPFLRTERPEQIEKLIQFEDLGESGLIVHYVDKKAIAPYKQFLIMINPSLEDLYYEHDDYMTLAFSDKGYVYPRGVQMKQIMIEALSLLVFVRE